MSETPGLDFLKHRREDLWPFEAVTKRLTLMARRLPWHGVARNGLAEAMHIIGSVVLILWLILGAIAAGQRSEYTRPPANCSQVGSVAVTILAGPLNWLGVNPKISCHLPSPSK